MSDSFAYALRDSLQRSPKLILCLLPMRSVIEIGNSFSMICVGWCSKMHLRTSRSFCRALLVFENISHLNGKIGVKKSVKIGCINIKGNLIRRLLLFPLFSLVTDSPIMMSNASYSPRPPHS